MNKKQKTVTLTKLVDPDVSFISIVDRGANRLPFRILKGDSSMNLNLATLFKGTTKKAEADKPMVTALILTKKADNEEVRKALVAAGFSLDQEVVQKSEGEDGIEAVIFKQSDEEGDSFVRLNEDLVVVCKGLYWDAVPATFQDRLNANIHGGMSLATDAMREAVWSAMYEATSVEELQSRCGTILDEFSAYMKDMFGKIPTSIVKLETGMRDAELTLQALKKAEDEPAPGAEEAPAGEADAAPVVAEAPVEAAPAEGAAPAAEPVEPAAVLKSEDFAAALASAVGQALAPVTERLTSIETAMQDQVKKVDESVDGLKKEFQEVKTVAESVTKVVKGAVIGQPATDPAQVITKSDESQSTVQDTAYSDTRQKRI